MYTTIKNTDAEPITQLNLTRGEALQLKRVSEETFKYLSSHKPGELPFPLNSLLDDLSYAL